MISGLNSSIAGIRAAQGRYDISAQNVVNVNTTGYQANTVHQNLSSSGTPVVTATASNNDPESPSDVDLAVEAGEAKIDLNALRAQTRAIKVEDRVFQDLVNLIR